MTLEIFQSFRSKIISSITNNAPLASAFAGQDCSYIFSYVMHVIRLVKSSRCRHVLYVSSSSVESVFITFFLIFLDCDVYILPSEFTTSSPLGKKLEASGSFTDSLLLHDNHLTFSHLPQNCHSLPLPDYKQFLANIHPQFTNLNLFEQIYSHNLQSADHKIVFTSSGSTGTPKLIPLSLENINACFLGCQRSIFSTPSFTHIACFHPCSFVIVLPYLFAFLANKTSVIFGAFASSSLFPQYQFRKQLKSAPNTSYLIISVPTVLRVLFDSLDAELPHAHIISCGEPLDLALAKRLISFKPSSFFNLYGSTEVSPWILSLNILEYFLNKADISDFPPILPAGSPLPHAICQLNSSSELLVSSECVFSGYINDLAVFNHVDGQTFYNTGDLFTYSNGFYFCNGRSNNAVKVSGMFVNPIVIEALLRNFFAIEHVLCIPEPALGSLSINFFQVEKSSKNSENITLQSVKYCLSEYLPVQIIVKLIFSNDSPRLLPSGKIDRKSYLLA